MKYDFKYLLDFIDYIDVVCPNCQSKACVISNPGNRTETKFLCKSCGMNKEWTGVPYDLMWSFQSSDLVHEGLLFGPPVDCYFKFPLWYQIPVKGNVFYAYNIKHLDFLENYLKSKLRERAPDKYGWSNQSLQSRLPKWMLSAKNRAELEKKLSELKIK